LRNYIGKILKEAKSNAQNSFKYFWYQVALDFYRIVPALELGIIKAAFREHDLEEFMWCNEVFYDGQFIEATLLNEPNTLSQFEAGQRVRCSFEDLWDWLCILDEEIYGGYTILALRTTMTLAERNDHDMAWGLPFNNVKSQPPQRSVEFEQVLAAKLNDALISQPSLISQRDEDGRTILHTEALFGRLETARALLERGADREMTCNRGWTPHDYAVALEWTDLASLLENYGLTTR
jgi:uncharacterized protein YegJ (DUF2314 family)